MRRMLELFGRLKMIEITFVFLFGVVVFISIGLVIRMRKRILPITENKTSESTTNESKYPVNPKIEEALSKGLLESLEKEEQRKKLVQAEKERLLKDDYIYEKIKNAVSENRFHFVMCTNNDEITRDAINLIPGMKAFIDKFSKLTVTFPNRE